ncbi:LysR family transcriptional regulator [Paraburkholderia tropica]|uniref:LysR family transcriptional regulator n=1 Tax=Paraburkholderia tropica TaxID=92647 RepID=UPI002AB23676|nr:LysR substrate-binding domain-containing protein [Paraburkholderia tropica]
MELRHLRCFLAVAKELHFARAAERLHIDQSPLSRTIRELEEDLGTTLFQRTTRSTRLTRAGKAFLEHVPRVFTALDQARMGATMAAAGYEGKLHLAIADGVAPTRLSALLALCREEDPEIAVDFSEVPMTALIKGLHEELYDVGFAQSPDVGDGVMARIAWSEPLVLAIPARHPLLVYKRIPLSEALRYPLVLGDPHYCEGYCSQVERVLRHGDQEPLVAERVCSPHLMMALVAAGYALALVGASQIMAGCERGVVGRRLQGTEPALVTWIVHRDVDLPEAVARFVERVGSVDSA